MTPTIATTSAPIDAVAVLRKALEQARDKLRTFDRAGRYPVLDDVDHLIGAALLCVEKIEEAE